MCLHPLLPPKLVLPPHLLMKRRCAKIQPKKNTTTMALPVPRMASLGTSHLSQAPRGTADPRLECGSAAVVEMWDCGWGSCWRPSPRGCGSAVVVEVWTCGWGVWWRSSPELTASHQLLLVSSASQRASVTKQRQRGQSSRSGRRGDAQRRAQVTITKILVIMNNSGASR